MMFGPNTSLSVSVNTLAGVKYVTVLSDCKMQTYLVGNITNHLKLSFLGGKD